MTGGMKSNAVRSPAAAGPATHPATHNVAAMTIGETAAIARRAAHGDETFAAHLAEPVHQAPARPVPAANRSEEHTSELQSH